MNGSNDPPGREGGGTRDAFAEDLASPRPTPGGGAAASRVGLYACSLIRMAAGITLEKMDREAAGPGRELAEIDGEARDLSRRFEALEDEDVAAFTAYLEALRLPRSSPAEKEGRRAARSAAAVRATEAPLRTMDAAGATLRLASRLLDLAAKHPLKAESDVGAAIELAAAAFRTAELNVRVNLPEIEADRRAELERRRRDLGMEFEALYAGLRKRVLEWLGG